MFALKSALHTAETHVVIEIEPFEPSCKVIALVTACTLGAGLLPTFEELEGVERTLLN